MAWKKIIVLGVIMTAIFFAISIIYKKYSDVDINNQVDCSNKNPKVLNDGDDCYDWDPCFKKCLKGKYDKNDNTCKSTGRIDIVVPVLSSFFVGFAFIILYIIIFE